MIKKIQQLWVVVAICLVIETIVLIVINVLKLGISLSFVLFVVANNILFIGAWLLLRKIIKENSLSVSSYLKEDYKNAFVYGGIGLINYDENRNIVWVSDLFMEMGLKLVGKKVLEWQPLLAPAFDDDDIVVIDVNSRKYEVYNNKLTRILYLKDTTDVFSLSKEVVDQKMCIGYLSIDSYDETSELISEEKNSELDSIIREVIFQWAKTNGITIKKYKSNIYLMIFNERIYRKIVEEKFNVLKYFRDKTRENGQLLTLSIGVGRGSSIVREVDEIAFSALQLAISRGGDQVAVKTKDENTIFFGGTTQNQEKENRVRARVIAQSLGGLIKKADNILIMGHKVSDFDSFGASVATYILCRHYGKEANIILDFDSIESKTKAAALRLKNENPEYNQVIINVAKAMEIKRPGTLLIVVDNHKPSLAINSGIVDSIKAIVVIDHHRRGDEFIKLPLLTYLEPAASSTVELVSELYEYQKNPVKLSEEEATILYTGILVDTNYFRVRVGARTFQVASKLKEYQADVSKAYEYLEDDYKTTVDKLNLSGNAYRLNDQMLITFGKDEEIYSRTLLAKVGNELMNVSQTNAVFVVGRTDKDEVSISARSNKYVNVQIIMEDLGGGGHFSMAATQIKNKDVKSVVKDLEEAVGRYVTERKDS